MGFKAGFEGELYLSLSLGPWDPRPPLLGAQGHTHLQEWYKNSWLKEGACAWGF